VSILVVALLLAFVGLAAFAADIGLGYAEKRQQSIAADASTLAAARAVNDAIPVGGSCNEGALEALGTVQTAASTTNSANDLDGRSALSAPVDVDCSGSNGVEVTVRNSESVPTTFLGSQLLGVATTLQPPGAAVSLLFVPTEGVVTGLKPIAACDTTLVNAIDDSLGANEPFLVEVNKTTGACDTANTGKWGYVNFLDQGQFGNIDDPSSLAYYDDPCAGGNLSSGGNAGCQGDWLDNSYQGPFYFPIPYCDASDPDPCDGESGLDTGLLGNSGQVKSTNPEFAALVGEQILLPVASGFTVGSGNNGRLDITGVMSAYVCAANLPPGPSSGIVIASDAGMRCGFATPSDDTGDTLPSIATATQPSGYFRDRWENMDSNEALLWVIPTPGFISGSPINPDAGCVPGAPGCQDFGVRAVQLWK
jgi:hypothetical protein